MASFVPSFRLSIKVKTGLMLGGFRGTHTGQWVTLKDGSRGRIILKPMFKGLSLPKTVAVCTWDKRLSFKANNAKFSRAVSYTKR